MTSIWNEVQKAEKPKGLQLAREFIGNLPNELPLNTQIAILDEFAPKRANAYVCQNSEGMKKYFIKVGDIEKYNKENNTDFARIPLLNKDGNQKMRIRKGRKPTPEREWRRIDLTGWNERVDQKSFFDKIKQKDTQVEKWRSKLCEIGNRYLNESNKWTHLSYKRQGLDILPTKHEGARVQWLEKGEQQRINTWNKHHPENQKQYKSVTDICKHYIAIQKRNNLVSRITAQINKYKALPQTKVKSLFQSTKLLPNEKQAQHQKQIYKSNNLKRRKNISINPRDLCILLLK